MTIWTCGLNGNLEPAMLQYLDQIGLLSLCKTTILQNFSHGKSVCNGKIIYHLEILLIREKLWGFCGSSINLHLTKGTKNNIVIILYHIICILQDARERGFFGVGRVIKTTEIIILESEIRSLQCALANIMGQSIFQWVALQVFFIYFKYYKFIFLSIIVAWTLPLLFFSQQPEQPKLRVSAGEQTSFSWKPFQWGAECRRFLICNRH